MLLSVSEHYDRDGEGSRSDVDAGGRSGASSRASSSSDLIGMLLEVGRRGQGRTWEGGPGWAGPSF